MSNVLPERPLDHVRQALCDCLHLALALHPGQLRF
jgi:hypothetical protein